MTRRRVLSASAVLALAATVWFVFAFATAGRIRAGAGGTDRVRIASLARTQRAAATVRYAGAMVVIAVLTGAGLGVARRKE